MSSSKLYTCKQDGTPCACSEIPARVQKGPHQVKWAAGDNESKWICRCGQSKEYPYCDSSHRLYNKEHGTSIQPLEVKKPVPGQEHEVWVCGCGHSKDRPFCDGTHKVLRQIRDESEEPAEQQPLWWPWTAAAVFLLAAFAYKKYHTSA